VVRRTKPQGQNGSADASAGRDTGQSHGIDEDEKHRRARFVVDKYATPFDNEAEYGAGEVTADENGDSTLAELTDLIQETGASAIYFNKRYEPEWREKDVRIVSRLRREPLASNGNSGDRHAPTGSVAVHMSKQSATLLHEPEEVQTEGFDKSSGWSGHWGTLMPFYKACKKIGSGEPPRPRPPPPTLLCCRPQAQGQSEFQGSASGDNKLVYPATLELDSPELGMAQRPKKRRGRRNRSNSPPRRDRRLQRAGGGKDGESGKGESGEVEVEDWGEDIRNAWDIGERAALVKLVAFVGAIAGENGSLSFGQSAASSTGDNRRQKQKPVGGVKKSPYGGLGKYETSRSRAEPTQECVSRLSPHLMFGELSPRSLHWAVKDAVASGLPKEKTKTFGRRLYWRDLAYYQLWCFPQMATVPVRAHYETQRWTDVTREPGRSWLRAWRKGQTGYPMVDAGMRELWETGYMMQNVRMVCAGFLTEYCNINWVHGVEWFHDTLVDADLAINAMMWQNAGRSGIDQWNFQINPESGSQDPTGAYVRHWIFELSRGGKAGSKLGLPTNVVHRPWRSEAWAQSRVQHQAHKLAVAADKAQAQSQAEYGEEGVNGESRTTKLAQVQLVGLCAYPDRVLPDLPAARRPSPPPPEGLPRGLTPLLKKPVDSQRS
jgi:deoxyribodipyrimidine photolyase